MPRYVVALAVVMTALFASSVANAAAAETIRLTTVETSSRATEDGFTFKERVYQGGELVGRGKGVCLLVTTDVVDCVITLTLPDGKIVLSTRIAGANRGTFKVVSGTGEYHGATGTGTWRNLPNDKTKITIKLS
jgi:hypothetical protein